MTRLSKTLHESTDPGYPANPQLIWFDPGLSTGIVIVSIRIDWLAPSLEQLANSDRAIDAGWRALGQRIFWRYAEQSGNLARIYGYDKSMRTKVPEPSRFTPGPARGAMNDTEIRAIRRCEKLLLDYPHAAWGHEDFVPRRLDMSRAFLSPVRVLSTLNYLESGHGYGRVPFVQNASLAKTTATDDRLKIAGMYFPGLPHATDAARHICTFLRRARKSPEIRHAAWPWLFDQKGMRDGGNELERLASERQSVRLVGSKTSRGNADARAASGGEVGAPTRKRTVSDRQRVLQV